MSFMSFLIIMKSLRIVEEMGAYGTQSEDLLRMIDHVHLINLNSAKNLFLRFTTSLSL